ncbi:endonuclease/exonuclease/phosphatase family protein [Psychroserpens sp. Hel_I_66]|uniref:endonuclease/exonuclease/phosphatase family protein n=1 Tax=Psychroserpens sp. Hel_I_66 TaxID=1250004 RepID=UPI000B0DD13A|nr:endonuclease/exonuclease/phosphatase family protein [Psychroserpens sp. Hel_I_66]
MKFSLFAAGLLFFCFFTNCNTTSKPETQTETENLQTAMSNNLKVMTYNMRLDVASDGENAWPNRKDFFTSQVLFLEPDILGVQEARPNQIEDLNASLKNYKFIGTGRDGEKKGEYSAIYYNSEKIKVEQENTFWLSQTPNEMSQGWDAAYPRICTYGLFTVLENNQKIWVFNTHLDHQGAEAQKEGMKLILEKIQSVNTNDFPVVITGDFNVEPNSEVIAYTTNSFHDTKNLAAITFGSEGTFNGFKYNEPATRRIDYILLSKSTNLSVKKYAVFSSAVDFKYPSDHFPVFVELEFK